MYSNDLICKILIYIDNNLNSKISISDLETTFYYNRYYIMKLFKQEIGITIIEYINSLKINNSIQLIRNSNNSITAISLKSGFYSLEYFSETFKQITKESPQTFKNYFNHKKNISNQKIQNIQNSIVKLYEISKIKEQYLSKQMPINNPVKKLSFDVFKK